MGRIAAIILAVTGTVALQVVAQAVLLTSVRFIGHRTRGAGEVRRTFWISLGAVIPLFFGHFAQVGLWAGFLVLIGALKTYADAFYFSLVTFATLGYGDIVLAPGYCIFGASWTLRLADARLVDRADLRRHQPRDRRFRWVPPVGSL